MEFISYLSIKIEFIATYSSPKVEPKVVQPKRKKLKTKPKEDDDDL